MPDEALEKAASEDAEMLRKARERAWWKLGNRYTITGARPDERMAAAMFAAGVEAARSSSGLASPPLAVPSPVAQEITEEDADA